MEANILVSRQCVFIKIFMTITDWSKNNGQCGEFRWLLISEKSSSLVLLQNIFCLIFSVY